MLQRIEGKKMVVMKTEIISNHPLAVLDKMSPVDLPLPCRELARAII